MRFLLLPDITTILTDLFNSVMEAVPNVLASIVIFVTGLIISKIVSIIVRKALEKLKIDQLGEKLNEIEMVSKANMEIKLSHIFSKAIYYFLLLFFMVAAAEVLNMPAVSDVFTGIFNFFPKVIVALLVMILGLLFAEFIRKVLETAMKSLGIGSAVMISNFIFYFLFVNIFIVALAQADINTDFLSQNLSMIIGGIMLAFAIAYGFASKDVVSNYIASLYAAKNINIGDHITIDNVTGIITEIDKSTFTIQSENSKVIIPLSKLTTEKIQIHS